MKLGIFGPQGSGKSFLAMLLVRSLQLKFSNLHIYTNMNARGDNINVISDLGDMPLDRNQLKVLIVDEAYFTLDSRNSNSKNNRVFSKVFAYFRKANVVLTIFITHRPRMIDVNIREQLDYVIMCRKNPTYFHYLAMDLVSQETKPFIVPKHEEVFTFANYDTYDFPLPIKIDSLKDSDLFSVAK
jgi:AAA15 family ATPase/GTPase